MQSLPDRLRAAAALLASVLSREEKDKEEALRLRAGGIEGAFLSSLGHAGPVGGYPSPKAAGAAPAPAAPAAPSRPAAEEPERLAAAVQQLQLGDDPAAWPSPREDGTAVAAASASASEPAESATRLPAAADPEDDLSMRAEQANAAAAAAAAHAVVA